MKLLVTGGCGFLGSNLAAHAIAQGIELCIFDSLYRHGSQENLKWLQDQGRFEFAHGDIRNSSDVDRVIKRYMPDVVFHLAGQVAMTTSIEQPRMDFEVNALGTLNVLEGIRQHATNSTVLYSSTNKVYGDLEQYRYEELGSRYHCLDKPEGFDETTPLDFHSPYGCSKGTADQYLLDYHRVFDLNTVVFRHSSMYGGRQFATADQGWIGWFCQMAAETKLGRRSSPFTISGNGKQVRDVLHAQDMVSLYFAAAASITKIRGKAFNVGGGIANSLSLLELFGLLEAEIENELKFTQLPPRSSDQRFFVADIRKLSDATGWRPVVSAPEGVSRMLKWAEALVAKGLR